MHAYYRTKPCRHEPPAKRTKTDQGAERSGGWSSTTSEDQDASRTDKCDHKEQEKSHCETTEEESSDEEYYYDYENDPNSSGSDCTRRSLPTSKKRKHEDDQPPQAAKKSKFD